MTFELVAGPATVQIEGHQVAVASLPLDVSPSGHTTTRSWRGVAGATGARLTSSFITVQPDTGGSGRSLGVVASGKERVDEILVDSPVAAAPVRSFRIPHLVRFEGDDEVAISGEEDFGEELHLVLTPIVDGPMQAPVLAVPPLPGKAALPPQLTGGSLSGSLFTVPDVAGARFRITLVKGDAPDDFEEQVFSHGDVTMYAAPMPVGLHVDGPDGTELFALQGPVSGTTTVDVTAAMRRHLSAAAAGGVGGEPVTAAITVRSDVVGTAWVRWACDGEVIERSLDRRLTLEISGAPARIALPAPHPGRAATRTVADVTVAHHGMAIHPISDAIPEADAGLGGPVVRDVAVVRALPPGALRGHHLTRVCVIGWPVAETDLTLEVLGTTATVQGLAAPVDRAPPSQVWFDLGAPLLVDGPVELRLTATRGAFGWVAAPEPLVRVAIAARPRGEKVTVGGHTVALTGVETVETGVALSGPHGWAVASDQLCTVSISNGVMEFAP